jgi:hypothetical protein
MSEDINLNLVKDELIQNKTISLKIIIIILVIINCFGGLFVWHLYDNKLKELNSIKSQLNIQKSIDETNAKLKGMIDRETNLYPKLQAQKDSLLKANKKLDNIQAKIGLVRKDKINAEVSKMDINALSSYLNEHGYSNAIISGGK